MLTGEGGEGQADGKDQLPEAPRLAGWGQQRSRVTGAEQVGGKLGSQRQRGPGELLRGPWLSLPVRRWFWAGG